VYSESDKQIPELSLWQILREANLEENIVKRHGHYLVDRFKIGLGDEYPGVDQTTGWYNRNLRIFANLQRLTTSPDERIILIIGSGHLSILRHTVMASPEYQLAEVHDYLPEI
jgi:hypothetical protein